MTKSDFLTTNAFLERASALVKPLLNTFGPLVTIHTRTDCVDANVRVRFGVEARLTVRLVKRTDATHFMVVSSINCPAMDKTIEEAATLADILSKLASHGRMVELAFADVVVKV